MRSIRPAEAAVVQAVLSQTETEAAHLRLPRRTRQTIRRRLDAWGWFHEGYVPELARLGSPTLRFAILEPFAEHRRSVIRRLSQDPTCLVLWAGAQCLLAVVAVQEGGPGPRLLDGLEESGSLRDTWSLVAPATPAGVPVYFDLEAAWVRAFGLAACRAYPLPLPWTAPAESHLDVPEPGRAEQRVLRELLGTSLDERSARPGGNGRREESLSVAAQRALRAGWAQRRAFLDPVAVARSIRGFPSHLILIHGVLRDGVASGRPREELWSDCGVGPFLYATDEREVLLAALSTGPGSAASAPRSARASVLATLEASLREIVVVREPLSALDIAVEHAYARWLAIAAPAVLRSEFPGDLPATTPRVGGALAVSRRAGPPPRAT